MTPRINTPLETRRNGTASVLMFGLTPVMGGVETFIYNVVAHSDLERVHFEFLVTGDERPVYADELESLCGAGCIHHVPEIRTSGMKGYREVSRFFREHGGRYDWMHLNTCTAAKVLYCYPFSKRYGFKVLAHSHNGSGYKALFNSVCRPVLRHTSNRFAACSDVAAEWLFGSSAATRTMIVKNGVDVDRFAFSETHRKAIRREFGIPDNAFVVGHVGRFAEQKNHKFLIETFHELCSIDPESVLLLVGTGDLEVQSKELANKLGVDGNVVFAGLRGDTHRFYSAMDVFAMPSLYEGLPVVGAEACSAGLKCLYSTNVSRQVDLIGTAEFLPLEEGAQRWAQRLAELKGDAADFNARAQAGAAVKAAGYDISVVAKKLNALYCGEEVKA